MSENSTTPPSDDDIVEVDYTPEQIAEMQRAFDDWQQQRHRAFLEKAINAIAGVELNCPHCGKRSPIAASELRRLLSDPSDPPKE